MENVVWFPFKIEKNNIEMKQSIKCLPLDMYNIYPEYAFLRFSDNEPVH